MPSDLILGSRPLLNYLIKGGSGFVGLQDRMAIAFPPSSTQKTPKVQNRYSYDATTKGIVQLEAPLPQALVTLMVNNRQTLPLFRRNRRPGGAGGYAWAHVFNMQWDVWGRTPVEVDAVSDALENISVPLANDLWDAGRIRLVIGTFEDAPYEIDEGTYRQLARVTCQTAATAA